MKNSHDDKDGKPKDGEKLAEEIEDLQSKPSPQDPTDGRGMPGDGSGGATGPG